MEVLLFVLISILLIVGESAIISNSGNELVYDCERNVVNLGRSDGHRFRQFVIYEDGYVVSIASDLSDDSDIYLAIDKHGHCIATTNAIDKNIRQIRLVNGKYLSVGILNGFNGIFIVNSRKNNEVSVVGDSINHDTLSPYDWSWTIDHGEMLKILSTCDYYHGIGPIKYRPVRHKDELYFHPTLGVSTTRPKGLCKSKTRLRFTNERLMLINGQCVYISVYKDVARISFSTKYASIFDDSFEGITHIYGNVKYILVIDDNHLTLKRLEWDLDELEEFDDESIYWDPYRFNFYSDGGQGRHEIYPGDNAFVDGNEKHRCLTFNNGALELGSITIPYGRLSFTRTSGEWSCISNEGEEYRLMRLQICNIIVLLPKPR